MNPTYAIYDTEKTMGKLWWLPPMVVTLAVVCTVGVLVSALTGSKQYAHAQLFALAALWAVGAPFWFFVEYYFFYRKAAAPDSWELFKHGQQLSLAIWVGISAALYALAGSDLAKPAKNQLQCSMEISASIASSPTLPAVFNCR